MSPKGIKLLTIFIFLILVFFAFKYYNYAYSSLAFKKSQRSFEEDLIGISIALKGKVSIDTMNYFIEKFNPSCFGMNCEDVRIKHDSADKVLNFYHKGFDGIDDDLKQIYAPSEVNFFESFFKKGDILLLKVTVPNRSEVKRDFFVNNSKKGASRKVKIKFNSLKDSFYKAFLNQIGRCSATNEIPAVNGRVTKPNFRAGN